MAKKRTKTRITSKIDELPPEVKTQVDVMLTDPGTTYYNIAEWLVSMGFKVSKSSVGRYAMRSNTAAQRLLEAQSRTQALVNVVRQNPDADYTEAGMMLMMALGQALAQAPQPVHFSRSTRATPSTTWMASKAQTLTQSP